MREGYCVMANCKWGWAKQSISLHTSPIWLTTLGPLCRPWLTCLVGKDLAQSLSEMKKCMNEIIIVVLLGVQNLSRVVLMIGANLDFLGSAPDSICKTYNLSEGTISGSWEDLSSELKYPNPYTGGTDKKASCNLCKIWIADGMFCSRSLVQPQWNCLHDWQWSWTTNPILGLEPRVDGLDKCPEQ